MEYIVLSLIVNGLLSFYFMAELGDGFGLAILLIWVFSLITSVIYLATRNRSMGTMALIGFALYVPIGLIGVYGVKGLIDQDNREKLFSK